jgi:hypothetical protein
VQPEAAVAGDPLVTTLRNTTAGTRGHDVPSAPVSIGHADWEKIAAGIIDHTGAQD